MPSQSDTEHLLRRTEFVARTNRVNELLPLSRAAAVDNVMAIDTGAWTPSHLMEWKAEGWDQYVESCNWWITQMAFRPRPFLEKMVLFWHGHLVSAWWDVDGGHRLMRQLQTYRERALGNFVDLCQAMAIDPAMLVYLSNAENRIWTGTDPQGRRYYYDGDPNQNFARELMELFTLGVGNYTEADIEAAASAWTGHNADWNEDPRVSRTYEFSLENHDPRNKTFFGVTRNWDGPEIIREILTGEYSRRTDKKLIAAAFIARKLWDFLAYPNPAGSLVDAVVADSDFANTMDIRRLARAILMRDEFYSDTAKRGLVRTPIEFFAALAYHTNLLPDPATITLPAGNDRNDALDPFGVSWRGERTGQQMFQPPNVSGWRPNGYWLNTSALSGRASIVEGVMWRLQQSGRHFAENEPGYNAIFNGTVAQAVDSVAAYFGITSMSATTRTAIVNMHMADRSSDQWWGATVGNLLRVTMLAPEFHMA
jgi:uncharacterized protein (DUF1800 family)